MKKLYERPSMAMNLFETADMTNAIEVQSIVAQKNNGSFANRYGITILDGTKLHS